jgi:hypothetical protein
MPQPFAKALTNEIKSSSLEYQTLVRAFDKEITPHIDQETARRVLDTNWLQRPESEPTAPKQPGGVFHVPPSSGKN